MKLFRNRQQVNERDLHPFADWEDEQEEEENGEEVYYSGEQFYCGQCGGMVPIEKATNYQHCH